MNTLCVAVFVAIVAAAHASVVGLGAAGLDSAAVLKGPSGTVVRSGIAVAAPAIAAVPALAAAPGLALGGGALGLGLGLGLAVPAGSGLEGQWIPDINEKLYDDGSYKPQIYGW